MRHLAIVLMIAAFTWLAWDDTQRFGGDSDPWAEILAGIGLAI
jgi:hypothetical protein